MCGSRGEECGPLGDLREGCGISEQGWKAGDGICKTAIVGSRLDLSYSRHGRIWFFKQSLCVQQREWIGGSKSVQQEWYLIAESKL